MGTCQGPLESADQLTTYIRGSAKLLCSNGDCQSTRALGVFYFFLDGCDRVQGARLWDALVVWSIRSMCVHARELLLCPDCEGVSHRQLEMASLL